jgi:hypothetical protein
MAAIAIPSVASATTSHAAASTRRFAAPHVRPAPVWVTAHKAVVAHVARHRARPAVAPPQLPATPKLASAASVAATFTVDDATDAVPATEAAAAADCAAGNKATCDLRAAIEDANDAAAGKTDAVDIPSGMHLVLSKGTLDLDHSMFINGAGASVNGGGTEVFEQQELVAVEISGLEILGGGGVHFGGAIDCEEGTLVLSSVDIAYNTATDGGGGIYNDFTCELWVDNSTVRDNSVPGSDGDGGGIYTDGSAYISRSVIGGSNSTAGNVAEDGAGLYDDDGTDVVSDSTVNWNSPGFETAAGTRANATGSPNFGEGVGIFNDADLDVIGSTIDHNSSSGGGEGGGILNDESLNMSDSTLSDNSLIGTDTGEGFAAGAGFYGDGSVTTLSDVSFDGNFAHASDNEVEGGAVYSEDAVFNWTGGSVAGTTSSVPLGSGAAVLGGAVYLDAAIDSVDDVSISATTAGGSTGEGVSGGAIYVSNEGADPAMFRDVSVTGTKASGGGVFGGAIYNDDFTTFSGVTIAATSSTASSTLDPCQEGGDGGCVNGGAIFSDEPLSLDNVSISGTDTRADLGTAGASATESDVYGGAVALGDEADCGGAEQAKAERPLSECGDQYTVSGLSITGTTVTASGGNGHVFGGGIDSVIAEGTFVNTQVIGLKVQADAEVEGGGFANDGLVTARNFTIGDATISVLGSAVETDPSEPEADGSILYNDELGNIINGTFANVVTTVPAKGDGSLGFYTGEEGGLQLTNTTIANDTMAGPKGETFLVDADFATIGIRNSIVDSSTPALNCDFADGSIVSSGHDIDNGSSCKFTSVGDLQNTNPMVLPLAANDGPVETAALTPPFYGPFRAGSPAINAGSNVGCPAIDARGVIRPQQGICDIGSYELPAEGYDMSALDGGLFHFGAGAYYGSVAALVASHAIGALQGPISAIAPTPDHGGYWQAGTDGGVFTFGDAKFRGAIARLPQAAPIVGVASTADGAGYWLVGSDGQVYPFGDATYHGSEEYKILHETVVGIASTTNSQGYWLVTTGGEVLAFGDAVSYGDLASVHLSKPIVGITATPNGRGYWLVGSDGGIFAFGDAKYYGSMGGSHLNKPIVAIASTSDGFGYWMFASDGGVFNFGDAQFLGSMGGTKLVAAVSAGISSNY